MQRDEEMTGDLESGGQEIDAQLRAAILDEPVDTAALDARIRQQLGVELNRMRIQRGKWIAAASIAAILVVGVGGYFLPNRGNAAMCADAARDHRMEVVEQGRRNWLTDGSAIGALAARRGFSAAAAQAIAPPGYRLERGKLCRLGGRVFLHLVYSDGAHEFSFYLRDHAASEFSAPVDADREHVAQVESARFTAFVVSDESRAAALEVANFAAERL